MAKDDVYRHRTHINAVLRGSCAGYAGWAVLEALCRLAEFDRPEVTVTKKQLQSEAKRGITQTKAGLKFLREEGTIVPIRNFQGGRGNATTYRLCVAGGQGRGTNVTEIKRTGQGAIWDRIAQSFRQVDPAAFKAWVNPLEFVSLFDGNLKVAAPTEFAATYVQTHIADKLLAIGQGYDTTVKRVTIMEP